MITPSRLRACFAPADGIPHCCCICCAFNVRRMATPSSVVLPRVVLQYLAWPFSRGSRRTRNCLFFEHPWNCFFYRARAHLRARARALLKGSIRKKICCTGSNEPPAAVDTGLVMTTSTASQTRLPRKWEPFVFLGPVFLRVWCKTAADAPPAHGADRSVKTFASGPPVTGMFVRRVGARRMNRTGPPSRPVVPCTGHLGRDHPAVEVRRRDVAARQCRLAQGAAFVVGGFGDVRGAVVADVRDQGGHQHQ